MATHQATDADLMGLAIQAADQSRLLAPPNPWVGAVVVQGSRVVSGSTEKPGGRHAERVALDRAGRDAAGATLYSTLEPCCFTGRTGPCTDAIIDAGVSRVVVGLEDPDVNVAGTGVEQLRAAGITVDVGVAADVVTEQLLPYLHHRRTGRPWVVLKLASSLDGGTAAPDGSSQWITGPEARRDVHRIRAESDAILVGAGTLRTDNPRLTVRDWEPPSPLTVEDVSPQRFVLGSAPAEAHAQPVTELTGELPEILDHMGSFGILQLMVEGGAQVASQFHGAGLVNEYVVYQAPAFFGGADAVGLFRGKGAPTMGDLWRGQIVDHLQMGDDLRIRIRPLTAAPGVGDE